MRQDHDDSTSMMEQVSYALNKRVPLRIQGGNTKANIGRKVVGEILDTRSHRGIISYDPTELVLTARAGTPLTEIEAVLEAENQMLPFEPPHLGQSATLGGMVASGFSGPRRPWAGSVRDYVLGTRIITGHGKLLRFGGEVMKNVAGYDLSRLMAGSFGCLGLLTEISLKVLPKPRQCASVKLELDTHKALAKLAAWGQQPIPISAASHDGEFLHLRLEGGEGSVKSACERLGGEALDGSYWSMLRERQLPFFDTSEPLWRISVPNNSAVLNLPGKQLLDWGGAQRWLLTDEPAEVVRLAVTALGGHATRFGTHESPFQPLPEPLLRYHQRLKLQLDPQRIFNPGRMYAEV
jgi:glycolate oxidase FAD binding subunit